jgi:hypothetical protein
MVGDQMNGVAEISDRCSCPSPSFSLEIVMLHTFGLAALGQGQSVSRCINDQIESAGYHCRNRARLLPHCLLACLKKHCTYTTSRFPRTHDLGVYASITLTSSISPRHTPRHKVLYTHILPHNMSLPQYSPTPGLRPASPSPPRSHRPPARPTPLPSHSPELSRNQSR